AGQWHPLGAVRAVTVPPGATVLEPQVRADGPGRWRLGRLLLQVLPQRPTRAGSGGPAAGPEVNTGRGRILLVTGAYPSPEHPFAGAFIHTRVQAYHALGAPVDVFEIGPRPDAAAGQREFEGITIATGGAAALQDLIATGLYRHVAVHVLTKNSWRAIRDWAGVVPLTVWVHGSEIQPWTKRRYDIVGAKALESALANTHTRMAMWREVCAVPGLDLVFVSQTFRREVAADLAAYGIDLAQVRTQVVPNPIDTGRFAGPPKDPAQRTKILMIRTFFGRKYGTDLAVSAIGGLAAEPWFDELEFTIAGDGPDFEATVAPLREYANVQLWRGYLTHAQIAQLQASHGVMLMPTRWDSQGVSRDEAMAAGLVVITNAVAAVPEFISDQEGYLAPADDWPAMADAVRDLHAHPEVFAAKSAAAAARVRATLAAPLIAAQELSLLST
ncbi:MAG: glycosyltransferase family 4 protein, partial [Bifidobacteriaceae bacterium]|nr:glycosyltransferase family 4 protein [Bifidobacteriaceae bacterium]